MQTINLKFEKLDRLPVPESQAEYLAKKYSNGSIAFFPAIGITTGCYSFAINFDKEAEYAHIKVTATETDFKVGDRVQWEHHKAKVIRILQDTKEALIKYSVEVSVMGFPEYNDHETKVPLTDLTLISND